MEYPDILFGRINIKTNNIFFNLSKNKRTQNQVIVKARDVGSEITVHGDVKEDIELKFKEVLENYAYYGTPGSGPESDQANEEVISPSAPEVKDGKHDEL